MIKQCLLLLAFVSAQCVAAVPSQFIARQYTEALGRAPDAAGWQYATDFSLRGGCSASVLQSISSGIFASAEYKSRNYGPEETVLTLYRAILAREPDDAGFLYWSNYLRSGHTAADVVPALVGSEEFGAMLPAICRGNAYASALAPRRPIDTGAGIWSQARLEICLKRNAVCSVPARTVVYLTSTLTIPAGKVLETAGAPGRRIYARQARLVRDSGAQGILVLMQQGAVLRNIWVSGGRERFKAMLRDQGTAIANVFPNINYVGGDDGVIRGVRSDEPLSATHIAAYPMPAPKPPTLAGTFDGTLLVDDNLTTGYVHSHYNDGTPIPWADGISIHVMDAKITRNHIVDPTDVGIVIFGHDVSTQRSTASDNTIVHAGHSAYGSLGLDTIQCVHSLPRACAFSGTGYTDNLVLAGRNQHVDIMLFNGTAPWVPADCISARDGHCGSGGRIGNTRTIMGDANQAIHVQAGITVGGMLDASTSGNALNIAPMGRPPELPPGSVVRLACAREGHMIINALGAGQASGALQAGSDADSAACIGH